MKAEARRIQERAAHDREIRHAMLLRGPSGFDSDASDNFDPDIEDPDEWWQDLQDGKVPKTVIQPKKKSPMLQEQQRPSLTFVLFMRMQQSYSAYWIFVQMQMLLCRTARYARWTTSSPSRHQKKSPSCDSC